MLVKFFLIPEKPEKNEDYFSKATIYQSDEKMCVWTCVFIYKHIKPRLSIVQEPGNLGFGTAVSHRLPDNNCSNILWVGWLGSVIIRWPLLKLLKSCGGQLTYIDVLGCPKLSTINYIRASIP